jgi:hypothetical protein
MDRAWDRHGWIWKGLASGVSDVLPQDFTSQVL